MDREQANATIENMIAMLRYWKNWNKRERDLEKLSTDDDTAIITVPPHWPTHGQIDHWIAALEKLQERNPH